MTTVAPQLEEEIRHAWDEYLDAVRTLDGRPYEDVEGEAWERLQAALGDLEAGVAESAPASPDLG
jgi:hypothetical protein